MKEQAEIVASVMDAIKNWQLRVHCPLPGDYTLQAYPDKNGSIGIGLRATRIN